MPEVLVLRWAYVCVQVFALWVLVFSVMEFHREVWIWRLWGSIV